MCPCLAQSTQSILLLGTGYPCPALCGLGQQQLVHCRSVTPLTCAALGVSTLQELLPQTIAGVQDLFNLTSGPDLYAC